ncbi:hypothetical protein PHSC3_001297 [Chlamydiales bacterium STE3]|nr:hypothetical protein PHSC3_001297 [Chlamydiales bacterium STE3]
MFFSKEEKVKLNHLTVHFYNDRCCFCLSFENIEYLYASLGYIFQRLKQLTPFLNNYLK